MRAVDLNYTHGDKCIGVKQLKGRYDYDAIEEDLTAHKDTVMKDVENRLRNNDLEGAIDILDSRVKEVHRNHRVAPVITITNSIVMGIANKAFDEYM